MKVLDSVPFRGSYVSEFELSRSNLVNRIIKITHAHNLHVELLDFGSYFGCIWVDPNYKVRRLIQTSNFTCAEPNSWSKQISYLSLKISRSTEVVCNNSDALYFDSISFLVALLCLGKLYSH